MKQTTTGKVMRSSKGFTLLELMIVVAVISILAAIGLPSYQSSIRKSNRADALATLMDTAQRLERCFTSYGSYNNTNCPVASGAVVHSGKLHYDITVTSAANTYSLTATPVSAQQLKDTACASFTIDQTGKKTSTPTGSTCW